MGARPTFSPPTIAACARELPVAPGILAQMHTLLAVPDAHAEEFAALISHDPALSARVMRVASSPHFSRGTAPTALGEAMLRLGLREIARIASSLVIRQLAAPMPAYSSTLEEWWRKSVACAYAMELLSEEDGGPPIDFYLIGLLHAVGELLVARGVPKETRFHAADGRAVLRQETKVLGWHQGTAAAYLLRSWNLSETIVCPIEHQFAPLAAPKPYRRIAERLFSAKWMSLYVLGDLVHAVTLNPMHEVLLQMENSPLVHLAPVLKERLGVLDAIAANL